MKKSIGVKAKQPDGKCDDPNCPFHGTISLHGRVFTGRVKSDKASKTVTVEWDRVARIQKYERFEKRKSKVKAHNPDCINAKIGDIVSVMETRPISKTKKFVVIEVHK